MNYLNSYLATKNNEDLQNAIRKTVNDIVPQYIDNFSYSEHVVSLLIGDVQSGKTSHMFGLISAAADSGFFIFVLLTTDNTMLQQQTYKRALHDLPDFCICDENDYIKFLNNNLDKPVLIILKKNTSILKKWKNNFVSTNFVAGNPLFIVDDEGDAASLNTLVNQHKQSTINKNLEEIKKTTSSSIYLEVTGTPQAIFLQSFISGWKPQFVHYFKPGNGYLGGNFYFKNKNSGYIIITNDEEMQEILSDDEFPENGIKKALLIHLISSAQELLNGQKVCNFLIHPSVKTEEHSKFAEKVGEYLNEINLYEKDILEETFQNSYNNLKESCKNLLPLEKLLIFIKQKLVNDEIKILVLNSKTEYVDSVQYERGINILIGGNTLGRGVTFPRLQTVYYCRLAKNPQADTMWQHARMFGYDRNPELIRIFMPSKLFKLFNDINETNNNIIAQILNNKGNDIKLVYPNGLNPTRKNIIDKAIVGIFSGGVNYFPFSPSNEDIEALDNILESFDGLQIVNLHLMVKVLEMIGNNSTDWDCSSFIGFLNGIIAEKPGAQGILIVRRNRDIAKGTGTLLSPNDRKIGDEYTDKVVLTLYKVTGNKGWNGEQIWIPNIKLPGTAVYYSI